MQVANLVAAFVPGAAAIVGWWVLRDDPRLAWLDPRRGSWHFAVIAGAGLAATAAGFLDWRFHRRGGRVIGARERRAEFCALVLGGIPLLVVTSAATLADDPRTFLVPAVATALVVVAGVCVDEVTFHRRCSRREALYHHAIEAGMALAWLTWVHGCFVARGAHA